MTTSAETDAAATVLEDLLIDDTEEALKAVGSTDYYDETLDDEDEEWAIKQRQGRRSDGILSCPACFTTLCMDCQRHEKYVHQYRAMFVQNCRIVENERLRLPAHRAAKKTRKSKKKSSANETTPPNVPEVHLNASEDEVYKPVRCSVCDTEVALMDNDEVYHFHNVVPSYS
ncbi:hypothetical protein MPTK1_7g18940 [Marchantia polymorpha subsp. ruderalis]|uniref:E2F-associated phosphoprotein n=2 Tax=Marchantia polymorpha TaxID=3197 RepID=A0AAF6C194_MARPO|nr:hypothetical protein MARPO_0067s0084 [Marchantia polymorpha]BBN18028.1 hypothetical protein Mp_7g18940 [Marchantia polymorpha subsp. ruderalis]|eukprot:PTQ36008.1 hypothetical protein MARPO_0067s0084 [Marchantia polymorpha]